MYAVIAYVFNPWKIHRLHRKLGSGGRVTRRCGITTKHPQKAPLDSHAYVVQRSGADVRMCCILEAQVSTNTNIQHTETGISYNTLGIVPHSHACQIRCTCAYISITSTQYQLLHKQHCCFAGMDPTIAARKLNPPAQRYGRAP